MGLSAEIKSTLLIFFVQASSNITNYYFETELFQQKASK